MPKAKNLKYCRTKLGYTQQGLANAVGISAVTVNNWEARKRAIPVPSSRKLADFFGVTYEEFCDVDLELLDRNIALDSYAITDSEIRTVLMFREIPEDIKQMVRHVITSSYQRAKGETK